MAVFRKSPESARRRFAQKKDNRWLNVIVKTNIRVMKFFQRPESPEKISNL